MNNSVWDDLKRQVLQSNNRLIQLIALNVALFLAMAIPVGVLVLFGRHLSEGLYTGIAEWLFLPGDFMKMLTRPWTLFTHFFLHSFSLGHILFNMLFLYWFGRIYHNLLGNEKTLNLYVFAGLVGGVAFMLAANLLPAMSPSQRLVGASGAVTAFVVGAATLTPHTTIRLLFFGDIKIWYIAAFQVIVDVIFIAENTGGRVAHLAGGAVGYFYVRQLQNGVDYGSWVTNSFNFLKAAFSSTPKSDFKVHRNETSKATKRKAEPFENISQEEIDAILDKIAQSGYDSLSKREKDILFKVSDKK